jgi:hypothetical protein
MKNGTIFIFGTGMILIGFFIGKWSSLSDSPSPIIREIQPEIAIIQLQKILGDSLHGDISGPVRILWAEENIAEGEGSFIIPLGQIPKENDLKYEQFPYTGNAKTMKFYPSDSYFARGVAVRYRRFFHSQQEAIDAGFIPSKSVK